MGLKFIDLFAGVGGFHLALKELGHQCVFACEIDSQLNALYERNFGLKPRGDIKQIDSADIPDHDILCAGFPCQPFSQAGRRNGFKCPDKGDLFDCVIEILCEKAPDYFILENVPHLKKHDGGRTWQKLTPNSIVLDIKLTMSTFRLISLESRRSGDDCLLLEIEKKHLISPNFQNIPNQMLERYLTRTQKIRGNCPIMFKNAWKFGKNSLKSFPKVRPFLLSRFGQWNLEQTTVFQRKKRPMH